MISVIAVIMAVLMLLSLVASVIPSAFAISQSDIDALQAKKDEISARVKEAEARVDTLKEAQANVLDQKAALEEKNDAAKEALRLVGEEIVMYDGIIEEKTEELNLALNREQTQLEKYRVRVRAMEETGGYNILTVLLSSGDFNEFLTALDDMEKIMDIAIRHNLFVVEDAAQAIDSYYRDKPLGGIGHFGCFSFHETKNVTAGGEGGLLCVNDERFIRRAEIIWEKGTNRADFFRGMVNKYGWVDIGSSFLPSEINSAFLYAQLESLAEIQSRRQAIWKQYHVGMKDLSEKGFFSLPDLPDYATNNGHMFYIVCRSLEERTQLIGFLKEKGILAPFHYLSLHLSDYYHSVESNISTLPNCDKFADRLVRLPMFFELKDEEVLYIIQEIHSFYSSK